MNRLVQRSTVIAAKGWPVAVRNADSGDFDEAYDQAGRLLRSTNGAGETLKYTWDLRGNLIQTTQPMGQATRAAYDARNRKILEIDANGALATWSYTYFGQLAAHRVIRSAPAGLGVDYITLQRQQSAATGNAALQARQSLYDANGRMVHQKTTEYLVAENAVNYDYDAEGN
ncbi:RHS repeat domain-containing protein, partial [Variovorax sp. OV700]|uniref:RHS repeat domain-containing protein n=1 Tax=Variovorax sp. OV700 TaxID=1882826 RepID=UPI00088AAFF0